MSKMIPQNLVEKIQEQTDLVKLVSEYVKLQPSGRSLKGLCPFHSERTPSFSVDPEKQLFHCFGCGEGGDAFAFLMKLENLTFPEAVAWAGQRCGIRVELADTEDKQGKQELYGIMELAGDFFTAMLRQDSGLAARKYLAARGIDPQITAGFSLGLAPPGWEELATYLKGRGVSLQLAESLGLVATGKRGGYYDYFRQRLIFPIWDGRGRIIGFGGRLMEKGEPKYLNSPQTPLFQKGNQLYALHLAKQAIRQQKTAVVVEGYMDVLAAHEGGFTNTVASLGTALTADQAKALGRYAKRVILAYDADNAGRAATIGGMEILREAGLEVFVASFPQGEDPDSLIRTGGAQAFSKCLDAAMPYLDYQFAVAIGGHDLNTPRGRAEAGKRVVTFLKGIQNQIEREAYLRQAAERLGLSPQSLLGEVERGAKPQRPQRAQRPAPKARPRQITAQPAYLRAERQLLCLMLQKREIIEDVMHKLGGDDAFSHPVHREIAAGLAQSAASGEPPVDFKRNPDPGITVDDCIGVILQHNAKEKLSGLADDFRANLAGSIKLSRLMSATIKYKAFHDYLGRQLGRREG